MFISVVSFRNGEQIEVFQHQNIEEAKQEVKKQLLNYTEGEDTALIYEIMPNQKQPKWICSAYEFLDKE